LQKRAQDSHRVAVQLLTSGKPGLASVKAA